MPIQYTDEQRRFLELAADGKNVWVNACIGSGKTTAIQAACDLPRDGKVLYLTYNRRLLLEARARITNPAVDVHTFHSFAGTWLSLCGRRGDGGVSDAPRFFCKYVDRIVKYDAIVVDEYQDLKQDLGDMLWHIFALEYACHGGHVPQLLMVGDMDQKIYDSTRFDAKGSMSKLFDAAGGREEVDFTQCFRLNASYAGELGQAWNKSIVGVNPNCKVEECGSLDDVLARLQGRNPKDILVLGGNSNGSRSSIQNHLEEDFPDKFNKHTVYSSVTDREATTANLDTSQTAIFTTFDSAKGLERPVCVVCDYTSGYLQSRLRHDTPPEILKNMFLVAASRGKEEIVFYRPSWSKSRLLSIADVGRVCGRTNLDSGPAQISTAFDYRRDEDVLDCYDLLAIEQVAAPSDPIPFERLDGMIELGICAGIFAQACFFKNFDVDGLVKGSLSRLTVRGRSFNLPIYDETWPLQRRILYLAALETEQERYFKAARSDYVTKDVAHLIKSRLATRFNGDESVEAPCGFGFNGLVGGLGKPVLGNKEISGRADVLKDDIPWELKFTAELQREHYLQAALYALSLRKDHAMLWNLRDGELAKVRITDEKAFLRAVCRCVTKGILEPHEAVMRPGGGRREAVALK